ncbi:hypothetical protein P3W45_001668 [Vairimorpha bombi]
MNILTFIPLVYNSIHVHILTQSNKLDKTDSVYVIFPSIFRYYFTGNLSVFSLEIVNYKEENMSCFKEDVVVYGVHLHSDAFDNQDMVLRYKFGDSPYTELLIKNGTVVSDNFICTDMYTEILIESYEIMSDARHELREYLREDRYHILANLLGNLLEDVEITIKKICEGSRMMNKEQVKIFGCAKGELSIIVGEICREVWDIERRIEGIRDRIIFVEEDIGEVDEDLEKDGEDDNLLDRELYEYVTSDNESYSVNLIDKDKGCPTNMLNYEENLEEDEGYFDSIHETDVIYEEDEDLKTKEEFSSEELFSTENDRFLKQRDGRFLKQRDDRFLKQRDEYLEVDTKEKKEENTKKSTKEGKEKNPKKGEMAFKKVENTVNASLSDLHNCKSPNDHNSSTSYDLLSLYIPIILFFLCLNYKFMRTDSKNY